MTRHRVTDVSGAFFVLILGLIAGALACIGTIPLCIFGRGQRWSFYTLIALAVPMGLTTLICIGVLVSYFNNIEPLWFLITLAGCVVPAAVWSFAFWRWRSDS
jgi:hypothetical protein